MSGHSKWHNIQAKKGKADAARGKIFTKLGRELLIAVKQGGPDPAGNSKLKSVIAKCKAANMPNDTINNAIKKASSSNENYEEITYEGYGPNGVAVIVEASTDNKNRTAADVRHVFDKAGGNLGTSGCVSFGIFAALHFAITSFSFEFPAGSGPPAFTAINNSLPNFVNTFPLAASAFPFLACGFFS